MTPVHSPCRARRTHWKQTVLYLEDTLMVCQGEVLSGTPMLPTTSL